MSVPMREEDRHARAGAHHDPDDWSITSPSRAHQRDMTGRRTDFPAEWRDIQQRSDGAATRVSLACGAVGAILYFAVTQVVRGLELGTVGLILMTTGGLGLVVSDLVLARDRRARAGVKATASDHIT